MSQVPATGPITTTRSIRTPGAYVTIGGELEAVDRVYRLCNQGLIAGGYTIPNPDDNPWPKTDTTTPVDHDHLVREVERLRSEPLRQELADARIERARAQAEVSQANATIQDREARLEKAANVIKGPGDPTFKLTVLASLLNV